MLKYKLLTLLLLVFNISAMAQISIKQTREEYIEQYANIAVEHQQDYGIPASITLAQGILESGNGNSRLATMANNHFGIKCKSTWTGAKIYHDDDANDECFRAYDSAEDSYEDHAIFLTSSPRYADLFKLSVYDYKGWAHGLKKAGYATNPQYGPALIKLIEDYKLYKYNTDGIPEKEAEQVRESINTPTPTYDYIGGINLDDYIVSTNMIGDYGIKSNNAIPYIVAKEGDTVESIAKVVGMSPRRVRRINDLSKESSALPSGTIIYLERKAAEYGGEQSFYTVVKGDTLQQISQKYGIRLSRVKAMNKKQIKGDTIYPGEEINLIEK